MISKLIAFVGAISVVARDPYVIPYADGSDGWMDAFTQAKGEIDPNINVLDLYQLWCRK